MPFDLADSRVPTTRNPDQVLVRSHRFRRMTEDMRPQDETMDGKTLKFDTREHGGKYPDLFPNAIVVSDKDGRSCTYVPITDIDGQVVQSLGFDFNPETGGKFRTPLTG